MMQKVADVLHSATDTHLFSSSKTAVFFQSDANDEFSRFPDNRAHSGLIQDCT